MATLRDNYEALIEGLEQSADKKVGKVEEEVKQMNKDLKAGINEVRSKATAAMTSVDTKIKNFEKNFPTLNDRHVSKDWYQLGSLNFDIWSKTSKYPIIETDDMIYTPVQLDDDEVQNYTDNHDSLPYDYYNISCEDKKQIGTTNGTMIDTQIGDFILVRVDYEFTRPKSNGEIDKDDYYDGAGYNKRQNDVPKYDQLQLGKGPNNSSWKKLYDICVSISEDSENYQGIRSLVYYKWAGSNQEYFGLTNGYGTSATELNLPFISLSFSDVSDFRLEGDIDTYNNRIKPNVIHAKTASYGNIILDNNTHEGDTDGDQTYYGYSEEYKSLTIWNYNYDFEYFGTLTPSYGINIALDTENFPLGVSTIAFYSGIVFDWTSKTLENAPYPPFGVPIQLYFSHRMNRDFWTGSYQYTWFEPLLRFKVGDKTSIDTNFIGGRILYKGEQKSSIELKTTCGNNTLSFSKNDEASIPIEDFPLGAIFNVKENGIDTPYVLWQKNPYSVQLTRYYCLQNQVFSTTYEEVPSEYTQDTLYENSDLDNFITNTFLPRFPSTAIDTYLIREGIVSNAVENPSFENGGRYAQIPNLNWNDNTKMSTLEKLPNMCYKVEIFPGIFSTFIQMQDSYKDNGYSQYKYKFKQGYTVKRQGYWYSTNKYNYQYISPPLTVENDSQYAPRAQSTQEGYRPEINIKKGVKIPINADPLTAFISLNTDFTLWPNVDNFSINGIPFNINKEPENRDYSNGRSINKEYIGNPVYIPELGRAIYERKKYNSQAKLANFDYSDAKLVIAFPEQPNPYQNGPYIADIISVDNTITGLSVDDYIVCINPFNNPLDLTSAADRYTQINTIHTNFTKGYWPRISTTQQESGTQGIDYNVVNDKNKKGIVVDSYSIMKLKVIGLEEYSSNTDYLRLQIVSETPLYTGDWEYTTDAHDLLKYLRDDYTIPITITVDDLDFQKVTTDIPYIDWSNFSILPKVKLTINCENETSQELILSPLGTDPYNDTHFQGFWKGRNKVLTLSCHETNDNRSAIGVTASGGSLICPVHITIPSGTTYTVDNLSYSLSKSFYTQDFSENQVYSMILKVIFDIEDQKEGTEKIAIYLKPNHVRYTGDYSPIVNFIAEVGTIQFTNKSNTKTTLISSSNYRTISVTSQYISGHLSGTSSFTISENISQ